MFYKDKEMLNRTNTQPMPSQFVLTPEQKIALIEAKVERAEAQIRSIAELARRLHKQTQR